MIALYILLGIVLLLLLPLTARYRFCGEGRITIRYAGIPVYTYSTEHSRKVTKSKNVGKRKVKKSKKRTTDRLTEQLKKDGAAGVFSLLQEVIRLAETTFRRLFRAVRFGRCSVGVRLGGGDSADLAIRYGKLAGPIYAARSVLLSLLRIRSLELAMYPDFLAEEDTVTADIRMRACPLRLLWVALCTAISGMGMVWRFSNTQSEDGQNG